ncbi:mRNA 3' end processing factor, partial [Kappamyces sp. JEL0680]
MNELQELYGTALEDLTFNSRPIIINLTEIARENVDNAVDICLAIEKRLGKTETLFLLNLLTFPKVSPPLVVPLMYLMDSILKNVGSKFVPAFQKNLLRVFPMAYARVDQNDKDRLK